MPSMADSRERVRVNGRLNGDWSHTLPVFNHNIHVLLVYANLAAIQVEQWPSIRNTRKNI